MKEKEEEKEVDKEEKLKEDVGRGGAKKKGRKRRITLIYIFMYTQRMIKLLKNYINH